MNGYNVTGVKDEYLDYFKDRDLKDLKEERKDIKWLEVGEYEVFSAKLAARILELTNIPSTVDDDKKAKVDINGRAFLQKREEKVSESSLLTLVDDKYSVVEEEHTPISPRKNPTYDLHNAQTERTLKCSTCTKSFSNRSGFTRHFKTHINEKHFACLECNKSFHRSSHLRDHVGIHNNINRFKCEYCKETFVQRGQLKNAYKTTYCYWI